MSRAALNSREELENAITLDRMTSYTWDETRDGLRATTSTAFYAGSLIIIMVIITIQSLLCANRKWCLGLCNVSDVAKSLRAP